MKPQGRLIIIAALALFIGLGCQIADALADKPTPLPSSAPVAGPPAVSTARPAATSTVLIAAPTVPPVAQTLVPTSPTPLETIAPVASPTSQGAAPTSSPAAQSVSCINPNAAITSPGMNSTVSGLLEVRGTATQADMQYWKVEFRAETVTTYETLNTTTIAVTDGILARWSTKTVPNGVYFVRLVLVQKDGNFTTPCEIRITISN
jgi:hypothetical protein